MGVPVYSIFRGTIGAVDRYLTDRGRLILLESVNDVRTKIKVVRRERLKQRVGEANGEALETIVRNIVAILETNGVVSGNGRA